jgi:hypothetical protein
MTLVAGVVVFVSTGPFGVTAAPPGRKDEDDDKDDANDAEYALVDLGFVAVVVVAAVVGPEEDAAASSAKERPPVVVLRDEFLWNKGLGPAEMTLSIEARPLAGGAVVVGLWMVCCCC